MIPGCVSTSYQGLPAASSLPNLLLGSYPSTSGVVAKVEYHDTQPPFAAPCSSLSASAEALTNTSAWRILPLISLGVFAGAPAVALKPVAGGLVKAGPDVVFHEIRQRAGEDHRDRLSARGRVRFRARSAAAHEQRSAREHQHARSRAEDDPPVSCPSHRVPAFLVFVGRRRLSPLIDWLARPSRMSP